MGRLLGDLRAAMEKKAADPHERKEKLRLAIYSCHDTSLSGILSVQKLSDLFSKTDILTLPTVTHLTSLTAVGRHSHPTLDSVSIPRNPNVTGQPKLNMNLVSVRPRTFAVVICTGTFVPLKSGSRSAPIEAGSSAWRLAFCSYALQWSTDADPGMCTARLTPGRSP